MNFAITFIYHERRYYGTVLRMENGAVQYHISDITPPFEHLPATVIMNVTYPDMALEWGNAHMIDPNFLSLMAAEIFKEVKARGVGIG